jgi:hypothetical protein
MIADIVLFLLRMLLTAAIFGFVWTVMKPRTRSMRIVRAAVLVLCLLAVLAVIRATGA